MYVLDRVRVQGRRGARTYLGYSFLRVYPKPLLTYYLGGKGVHVGIQLCTRRYTTVYTRVHYYALSIISVEGLLGRFSGLM